MLHLSILRYVVSTSFSIVCERISELIIDTGRTDNSKRDKKCIFNHEGQGAEMQNDLP